MAIQINTKQFGAIDVDDEMLVDFPDGLFGFDHLKKFALIDEEESPMTWLQSCDEPELAFVILRVLDFMDKYDLSISGSDLEAVKTSDPKELDVYAIVTIPVDNPADMTANLMGPIVIHEKAKIGRQVISLCDKYKTKHRVLEELKAKTGE